MVVVKQRLRAVEGSLFLVGLDAKKVYFWETEYFNLFILAQATVVLGGYVIGRKAFFLRFGQRRRYLGVLNSGAQLVLLFGDRLQTSGGRFANAVQRVLILHVQTYICRRFVQDHIEVGRFQTIFRLQLVGSDNGNGIGLFQYLRVLEQRRQMIAAAVRMRYARIYGRARRAVVNVVIIAAIVVVVVGQQDVRPASRQRHLFYGRHGINCGYRDTHNNSRSDDVAYPNTHASGTPGPRYSFEEPVIVSRQQHHRHDLLRFRIL